MIEGSLSRTFVIATDWLSDDFMAGSGMRSQSTEIHRLIMGTEITGSI